jgi:hypothetical protein
MTRDKNADKRLEFNRKIASKEHESDELHLEERQAQNQIENFEAVMMKSFRNLQEIEEEINRRSHIQGAYDETAQKQRYMSNVISQQKEGVKQVYQQRSLKLEDEREQLQKERDSLSWD